MSWTRRLARWNTWKSWLERGTALITVGESGTDGGGHGRPGAGLIAVVSAGGGCGATMIACHIAAEIGRRIPRPVLLADLDLGSGMVHFWTRTNPNYSLLDVAVRAHDLDDSLWQGLLTRKDGLDILAVPSELVLAAPPEPEAIVAAFEFARARYVWIVADLGAAFKSYTALLLPLVSRLIVVARPSASGLYQAGRLRTLLRDLAFPLGGMGVVLNRSRPGQPLGGAELERALGCRVLAALPEDDNIAAVEQERRLADPQSAVGRGLARLTTELTGLAPPADAGAGRGLLSRLAGRRARR